MKRAQRKDFIREIRRTRGRFLSLFFIVALGCAFYAGIRSAEPDMKRSGDRYYDEAHFMDVRILGTLGLTEEDVAAVREAVPGAVVEAGYETEVLGICGEDRPILRVVSMQDELNAFTVTAGRLPEAPDECFLDGALADKYGYAVGDLLTVTSEEGEAPEALRTDTFTIVGTGNWVWYLTFDRGQASIGDGTLDAFAAVPETAFDMEVRTVIYAGDEVLRSMDGFSDAYEDAVEERLTDPLEAIADARCEARYREVVDEAEAALADAKRELADARQEVADGKKELADGRKELADGREELADGKKALEELEQATGMTFADAWQELADKEEELADAEAALADAERELADAEEELADGESKVRDAEEEIADINYPEWYVLTRGSVESAVTYRDDAKRIGSLGTVFPAIFFLVAALVSLTTMTRMIEEERIHIGTMKALGYAPLSIASRYILYALIATLGGGLFGVLLGSKVLPFVIMSAYGMLYVNMPYMEMPYHPAICLLAVGAALLATVGAALAGSLKELAAVPASLMRPPAPGKGHKLLLERIPAVWRRLSFNAKLTIRNLLRYKKRLFMTIFGIGGCMSVLLVSVGLHDSIQAIVDNQYRRIWTYTVSAGIDGTKPLPEKEALREKVLAGHPGVSSAMLARSFSIDALSPDEKNTKSAWLYVVEDAETARTFVSLHDRVTGEGYALADDGVVVTEKTASMLGLAAGDEILIKTDDYTTVRTRITATCENYMYHYIYMTPALYETLFGEAPAWNELYLKLSDDADADAERAVAAALLKEELVNSVQRVSDLQATVADMMHALDLVVWVLVVAAGLLVFVVTWNLNNINISERRRELASLKVLGMTDGEVAMAIYRENIVLTLFGILAGLFMGTALHRYVILTLEVEYIMFGRVISTIGYIEASLLTAVFSVAVNLLMYGRIRAIDMVESLKSIE